LFLFPHFFLTWFWLSGGRGGRLMRHDTNTW
jgi:hypothetical protein